jgi:hypothetical protein
MKSYDLYYFLLLYTDWIKNDPNNLNNPLGIFEFDSQGFLDGRVNRFMETAGLRPFGFNLGNIKEGSATYLFDSNKGIHFCIRDQENQEQVFCGGVYTSFDEYKRFFDNGKSRDKEINDKIIIMFEAIVKIANEISNDVKSSRDMKKKEQEIILNNVFFLALSYLNPYLFRSWIRSSLCYLLERFKSENITSSPNSPRYTNLNDNETFKVKLKMLKTISNFYYSINENSNKYFDFLWKEIVLSDKKNYVRIYHTAMKELFYDECTNRISDMISTNILVNSFYNARVCRRPKKEDKAKFLNLFDKEKKTVLYQQISKQVHNS